MPARKALEGIFYVLRTGFQWEALPQEYGSGSTVHRTFPKWLAAGFFEKPKVWKSMMKWKGSAGRGKAWMLHGKRTSALESVGKNPTDQGKNGDKTQCPDTFANCSFVLRKKPPIIWPWFNWPAPLLSGVNSSRFIVNFGIGSWRFRAG
ncbi:MAG: transposase [Oscillospiraceae bacterium]|nr:transposase [Oscillospiraceae bacterium]